MTRRVTIKDVARVAGVSYQTVSRAINGKAEIAEDTRTRVLAAARSLGFRPSRFGRGLVKPDTVTIGLIVPDIVNPFYPEFVAGVLAAAGQRTWRVIIASSDDSAEGEADVVATLAPQVDGMVGYLNHLDAPKGDELAGMPLVLVDREPPQPSWGAVALDIEAGTREGLAHLLDRGHRRIGMVDCAVAGDRHRRRNVFHATLREHGLPVDDGWVVEEVESIDGGEAGTRRLLDRHPDMTAVFAFNDLMAVGVLRALRAGGRRVPEDCAVLGFDGLTLGELVEPALSTIHVDKRLLGELAVSRVAEMLADLSAALSTPVLRPQLVVRGST